MIIDQVLNSNNKNQHERLEESKASAKPIRSILKAISWRIIGTMDTMVIAWLITGQLTMAISIGSIEVVTKMILYYGHERLWNAIKWKK